MQISKLSLKRSLHVSPTIPIHILKNKYQKHEACGFGYEVVCHYDKQYSKETVIYRGNKVVDNFIVCMLNQVNDCQKVMKEHFNKPLVMSNEDEKDFQNLKKCHISDRKYKEDEKKNIPVRDHCHITGKYRGSPHRDCNLKLQISADKIKIPVIFHNLKGYDSHFIIEKLAHLIKKKIKKEISI